MSIIPLSAAWIIYEAALGLIGVIGCVIILGLKYAHNLFLPFFFKLMLVFSLSEYYTKE